MKKINHLIMNTGEVLQYENNLEITGWFKEICSKIDWQAEIQQKIPVSDVAIGLYH